MQCPPWRPPLRWHGSAQALSYKNTFAAVTCDTVATAFAPALAAPTVAFTDSAREYPCLELDDLSLSAEPAQLAGPSRRARVAAHGCRSTCPCDGLEGS
jgi:hypothetical protein